MGVSRYSISSHLGAMPVGPQLKSLGTSGERTVNAHASSTSDCFERFSTFKTVGA